MARECRFLGLPLRHEAEPDGSESWSTDAGERPSFYFGRRADGSCYGAMLTSVGNAKVHARTIRTVKKRLADVARGLAEEMCAVVGPV